MAVNKYLPVITLNVNGLNAAIKRQGELNGKENITHVYAVYKRPPSKQKIHIGWKWRNEKKNIPCKWMKKPSVTILTADKTDFKTEDITRNKEGHYIILKEWIQQEDITLVNIYAPNIRVPKHIFIKTSQWTWRERSTAPQW